MKEWLSFEELPEVFQALGRRRVMYNSTKKRLPRYWRPNRNTPPMWNRDEVLHFMSTRLPISFDFTPGLREAIDAVLLEEFDGEPGYGR